MVSYLALQMGSEKEFRLDDEMAQHLVLLMEYYLDAQMALEMGCEKEFH